MWKIFFTKKTDLNDLIPLLEELKLFLFSFEENKIKEYFATKVVVYFDNRMIFHQKKGLHSNLLESLSLAENEMKTAHNLFKQINFYLIQEEKGYTLLISGLNKDILLDKFNESFKAIKSDFGSIDNLEKLKYNAWSTLVFDFSLVNFSQNWINFTPDLEERSRLQAEHILFNMTFKKNNTSLLEKVNFDKNINTHPQYAELLEKVLKIMPKIESSLEQEWRTKIINMKNERKIKTKV